MPTQGKPNLHCGCDAMLIQTFESHWQLARQYAVRVFVLTIIFFTFIGDCLAGPQVMVTPTRVVFDKNTRSAKVTVINAGDQKGTYRIKIINKRMTVDGQFEDIKSPQEGELFADKMIRFSPRQVELKPGQSQVVRLSLRKPSGLEAGEYRSHILFQAIPEKAESGNKLDNLSNKKTISIQLTAIISISIPVIVRHGDTSATVAFSSIKYNPAIEKDKLPILRLELERKGNRSVYGDLLAEFVDTNGNSNVVSQAKGVAVYSPNKIRTFTMNLKPPIGTELKNGMLIVYYRSPVQQGNKVLAKTQIKIP